MKIFHLFIIAAVMLSGACTHRTEKMAGSTGKPYDVYVVMDAEKWEGAPGDTLRSILRDPIPVLNQTEARLSSYHLTPSNYKGIIARHRNILYYQTGTRLTEPSMKAEYNVNAAPQLIVHVTGPDDATIIRYMDENREALARIFEIAERDRFAASARRFPDERIKTVVEQKFGLDISIPKGYTIRAEYDDFIWISYEQPLISQGIFIYKYPLTSRATFTEPYLLEKRNEMAAHIPGPNDGTYMTTAEILDPILSRAIINDRLWFEFTGFWDVKGGFMGGPFTSYTTINAATNEVITVDTYVYSPKYDKRNYVRQLESLIYTASIPGDTVGTIRLPEAGVE